MEGRKKKWLTELGQKPRLRRETGLFLADGPKLCGELRPEETEEVFVTRSFLQSAYAETCQALLSRTGYTEVTEAEMRQVSDTVTPQGILALVRQRKLRGLSGLLEASEKTPLLLLLETIQDPGNLGTILRAAEAAGVTGVVMNRGCVDIYAPKVVRSTMGAILRVPFVTVEDLTAAAVRLRALLAEQKSRRPEEQRQREEWEQVRTVVGQDKAEQSPAVQAGHQAPAEAPFQLYAAHLAGAVAYDSVSYCGPCGIMIGNESRGLSAELTAQADTAVKIPMEGAVESLNAAMASAILVFEAARQRRFIKKS